LATISSTPRPGYVWDSTDNVWYPIGTGPHTHADYITSGSAINPNIVDAKGDIIAATAADTVSRLAVGANNTVLTADSSTATGLKWAAAGGSLALAQIATGNINSGTSVTISSLSSYDTLVLYMNGITMSSFADPLSLQINSVASSGNYYGAGGLATNSPVISNTRYTAGNEIRLTSGENLRNTGAVNTFILTLTNCKATGFTTWQYAGAFRDNTNTNSNSYGSGIYTSAAAVSDLKIFTANTATFDGSGTYTIWGA